MPCKSRYDRWTDTKNGRSLRARLSLGDVGVPRAMQPQSPGAPHMLQPLQSFAKALLLEVMGQHRIGVFGKLAN
jgi:hypothetical protein